MNRDTIAGTAEVVGGKIEESLGRATGSTKMRAEGLADQAEGKARKTYGEARDAVSGAAETAKEKAAGAADAAKDKAAGVAAWSRGTITEYPLTAVAATFVLGIFFGSMGGGGGGGR
jgi:uncharacterized protein YjbJ (UPF0337 family)